MKPSFNRQTSIRHPPTTQYHAKYWGLKDRIMREIFLKPLIFEKKIMKLQNLTTKKALGGHPHYTDEKTKE